jgi:NAD(P)-dependent dehydrogenase (short-subunit alcohol dehydrogenase family)
MIIFRGNRTENTMGQLDGKVAIITGAASGMGRAAAILFAQEGAHVVLADLNEAGGDVAAKVATQAGSKCVFQKTDVSAEADIKALVARALSEFGRLDIMFNNAGIGGAVGALEGISVEDWDKTQAVCLKGVFLGIKHSVAPMRKQGGGSIISTASIAGIDGYPGLHAYCAAKAGVVNLTRSASIEFAADKIRVNSIAPGGVSTPIVGGGAAFNKEATDAALEKAQPLPIAGQPEDIAQAALYLASDASRFVTGHCLVVDGGATAGAIAAARAPRVTGIFAGPSFQQGGPALVR